MGWRKLAIVGLMKKVFVPAKKQEHKEEVNTAKEELVKEVEVSTVEEKVVVEESVQKTAEKEFPKVKKTETKTIKKEVTASEKVKSSPSQTTATKAENVVKESTKTKPKIQPKKEPEKKKVEKQSTVKKTATKPKGKTTPSKRDQKIALYTKDIKKHLGSVDEDFLAIVVKNLGPSIYRKDAESVACSDPKELETVKNNFLVKKLQLAKEDKEALDKAVADVCQQLKGVRTKYRATFYYMLAKNLKKESLLS